MERLELAVSGVEQVLRPGHGRGGPTSVPLQPEAPRGADVSAAPTWLQLARQQLPRVLEALGAEQTDAGDDAFTARARRLAAERNRLLRRLRAIGPALADGCVSAGQATDHEELRRMLLRLLHDITHHHQRVNDLVYDVGWRDVGGSE